MPETVVSSLDDPRLEPYRNLKQTNLTRYSGIFIAEGWRVVLRLLQSSYSVDSILVSENRQRIRQRLPADVPVLVVPHSAAQQLVGYSFHAGVLACGRHQPRPELNELFARKADQHTIVACSHLTDPDNLGTIIRLCTAFGVQGLLIGPGCADPFSRRTLRVSMGSAFHLPIRNTRYLAHELATLRDQYEFQLTATVLDESATPLFRAQRAPREVLVFGNEATGLGPELLQLCSGNVTIPMDADTDSVNVGIAAGIILHYYRFADELRPDRLGQ